MGWTKCRSAIGHTQGQLDIGAKTAVVLVVIFLNYQRTVRELRLEMKSVRGRDRVKRAHQGRPTRAVRMNRPDSPGNFATDALRFQRAEHNPPIRERHWVERASDVQVADLFDIPAQALIRIVHDK